MLNDKKLPKDILKILKEAGYSGGHSILYEYCRRLSQGKKNNPFPKKATRIFVNKQDIIKYIWSREAMDENNRALIFEQYSELTIIEECVKDFQNVFIKKDLAALHCYYSHSLNSNFSHFMIGQGNPARPISSCKFILQNHFYHTIID